MAMEIFASGSVHKSYGISMFQCFAKIRKKSAF